MYLNKDERLDDLELKGLKIIQNKNFFCFGIDAVLLAHFSEIKNNEIVADFGSGTGIISILLNGLYKPSKVYAIEYQQKMCNLIRRNIRLNKLENKIKLINTDIRDLKELYKNLLFDVICFNPPYIKEKHGIINDSIEVNIARHEIIGSLEEYIKVASSMLKDKGRIYLVYRPNRLIELINILSKYKLEVKDIRFIHPKYNKDANMVLIKAIKNGGSYLNVDSPLVVYKDDGNYTEEILKIYGKI